MTEQNVNTLPVSCVFCEQKHLDVVAENDFALAIRDKFPVRSLHTLIIPKRHVGDIFETTAAEREAMHELAAACRTSILAADATVGGFNYGSNVGQIAGQKIPHAHVHLIPRRSGDLAPPAARPESSWDQASPDTVRSA